MSDRKEMILKEESMPERTKELPVIAPLVDIFENDDQILLHADMPGVAKEQISVHVDNGRLEISGVRKLDTTGSEIWKEFDSVEYKRVFSVPQSIDVPKVNAELKDGVLKLYLPKAEAAKPKVIEIRSA